MTLLTIINIAVIKSYPSPSDSNVNRHSLASPFTPLALLKNSEFYFVTVIPNLMIVHPLTRVTPVSPLITALSRRLKENHGVSSSILFHLKKSILFHKINMKILSNTQKRVKIEAHTHKEIQTSKYTHTTHERENVRHPTLSSSRSPFPPLQPPLQPTSVYYLPGFLPRSPH